MSWSDDKELMMTYIETLSRKKKTVIRLINVNQKEIKSQAQADTYQQPSSNINILKKRKKEQDADQIEQPRIEGFS